MEINEVIAERIGDRQIIVQKVQRYSRVLVCMYVYMSTKNSGLSIVGLKLNCTADCTLFRLVFQLVLILYPYSAVSFTYPMASKSI